jgi:DAHP synthase ferredoxin-like domain
MIDVADGHELQFMIVMGSEAADDQVEDVLARLADAGGHGRAAPGRGATVIGAIGERDRLAGLTLDGLAGVERILPPRGRTGSSPATRPPSRR